MKNYMFLPLAIAVASCGTNKIPDESDIQKSLQAEFGDCKYIKISDVKKLNGRDIGNGGYAVNQSYNVEFTPPAKHREKLEEQRAKLKAFDEIISSYQKDINELEQDENNKRKQIGEEQRQIAQSSGRAKSDEEFNNLKKEYDSLEKAIDQIRADYQAKREALNQRYKNEFIKRDVPDPGEVGVSEGTPVGWLNKFYPSNHLYGLLEMQKDFNATCPTISKTGLSIVYKLIGHNQNDQMKAFESGIAKSFTQDVVYVKTEKGWIPAD